MPRRPVFAVLTAVALIAAGAPVLAAVDAKIVKLTSAAPRLFHEDGRPAPDAKLPSLPVDIIEIADGRYKVRGADGQVYIVRALDVIVTGACANEAPVNGAMPTRPPGAMVAGVAAGAGKGC
jgi:hypothetical protein